MQAITHRSWLIPAIIAISLMVFAIDVFTPIGYMLFIFHFVPVILSRLDYRPRMPFYVALLSTLLSMGGYLLSPDGDLVSAQVGQFNRGFSIFSLWCLAMLVRQMIISLRDTAERDWIKGRVASLSLKIRGEKDTDEVGQEVLTAIAQSSHFKMAAIYYKHEHDDFITFLTGHAFAPAVDKKKIKLGVGFAGQAALDKKMIEVDPLPPDYIKMSSGMGEAAPRYLIVLPMVSDDELVAVAEFAFLQRPDETILKFLENVAELTAVALRSAQFKMKLSLLLQQSQQYSEELQAQQEELRVTNEELEQQSRALKDSSARLENQQNELEQTNQQLEEQAQIMEKQARVLDQKNKDLLHGQSTLEQKARELTSSGKYKSEFLANMSHELRTPLNSSLILAKLLSENKPGNMTEEQVKYADIIYQSGNDLLNLINDVLDLAKVEAGIVSVHPEVLPLNRITSSMQQTFGPQAQDKELKLLMEISPDCPETIITDRQRLEQILKNFLSNALKFTERGEVKVTVGPAAEGVAFAVTDSGIGISPEQQQAIFEAFRQADGTTNRKFGGTGLGLSISRELAQLLGGEISVKSTPGQGSTFTLTLPVEFKMQKESEARVSLSGPAIPVAPSVAMEERPFAAPGPVKKAPSPFAFQDDRQKASSFEHLMLIIEDDEHFSKILLDLAHEMDFGALVAATADEGIELAKNYLPQAIVLDIRLPDHNGLVVLDQLKMNPKTRHIPVHVMSSSDFSRSALEMGAAGYLMKPVKRDDLQTAFSNLSSVNNQKLKHVLVIEDNDIQRQHVVDLITDLTVEVDAVVTAGEALEKLSANTYDCMVMDLTLPDISGHELLSKLAADSSRYSFPPVIVYTARDLTAEEEEKLRLYSGSIIIKGAKSPERLLSEVTLFLHRVETEMPIERQKMLKDFRSRDKNLEGSRIMVVDDDVRNIFALTSVLENYGAHLTVARNGREALEKLNQTEDIDLVLMDIMMPVMDGYEAMTKIRQQKKFKDLAIIALTAKAMKDDKERCLAVGANDYLPKPIDIDKLLSLIRVWLPSKRRFGI